MTENLRFCFNIEAFNDEFYENEFQCQPFTRSDAVCTNDDVRTQFNGISSFIDASNVYGSDDNTAEKLRAKENGEMLTHELGPVLPTFLQENKVDFHQYTENIRKIWWVVMLEP